MRKVLKNLFKLNMWFFAGIIVVDAYGKVCEIHNALVKKQKSNNV